MLFSVSAGVASVPVVCQGHGNCASHASTRDFRYCPAALLFRHCLSVLFCKGSAARYAHNSSLQAAHHHGAAEVSVQSALKLRKYFYGELIVPCS